MEIYPDNLTVQEGLQRYFAANNFGQNGGYDQTWVKIPIGPLHISIPNTKARKKAVKRHDLHHLVTGYKTDLLGEAEIAAWELASGCKDYYAAWILNGLALTAGLFLSPSRMIAAFRKGWGRRNTYHFSDIDNLKQQSIGELRRQLGYPPNRSQHSV